MIKFSLITISIFACLAFGQTGNKSLQDMQKYPVLLYGPQTTAISNDTIEKISLGTQISDSAKISSGGSNAYILICSGQIVELAKNSVAEFDSRNLSIRISSGTMTIHIENPTDTLCFQVYTDSATVRYASNDGVWLILNGSMKNFKQGEYLLWKEHTSPSSDWYKKPSIDGRYLFDLIDNEKLSAGKFAFEFPSHKKKMIKQSTRGHAGFATYEGEKFIYGGILYKLEIWKVKFVYDFWGAISTNSGFYTPAWDEWKDLLNHIYYIEIFHPDDLFFLRAGLIENLTFGNGILVSNYNNAVFLPFEKLDGVELKFHYQHLRASAFTNDIMHPRLFGLDIEGKSSERMFLKFFYAGDFDIFANITDSDNDGYPDKIDPEPDIYNRKNDSIIVANNSQNLDDFDSRQIHGIGGGFSYNFFKYKSISTNVGGEGALLSSLGAGISFPSLGIGIKWFDFSIGSAFQSPHFVSGVFDRTYEFDKARFVYDENDSLRLITRCSELSGEKGWLYGWNYGFGITVPDYARFNLRFRDIYRNSNRDENFSLSLYNEYPFSDYIINSMIFIEQKNVSQLFSKMTDRENWGFEIGIKPHTSIKIGARYREQYEDKNSDNYISHNEIKRSFTVNMIINGNYWWRKFLKWRKERKNGPVNDKI